MRRMKKEEVVESSVTVQGRVNVVQLGEIALALIRNKIPVRTMSALINTCVDIAHQALEVNKYIDKKFENGPLEAFQYLTDMRLMTKTMWDKGIKKINMAQGLWEVRANGGSPEFEYPMQYKMLHNKHSVNHPSIECVPGQGQDGLPGTMSEERARQIAEEYRVLRETRIARELAEEKARAERMAAIVEQAERDKIMDRANNPALATPPCVCPEPEVKEVKATEGKSTKKDKEEEEKPINADDIDPANYDLEMSFEDRRKLTPRQQAEWRIAYQKNRWMQNQMKKQSKVSEAPRARGGEELEQFSAWKEKDLAKRDKELQDGFSQFDPHSCAIKED